MHLKKRIWGDFCDGSNRYLVVGVTNIHVTDRRGLSLWFLAIWSVGSSADNYFTGKNHWLLTSSHTFSMETNTFHDPEKATSLYTQSNVLFFLRKCHHQCFCCSCSLILWHFSVVHSFPQLELFSSASHGHKKSEHSFHFCLHIWADLGGKIFVEMVAEKLQNMFWGNFSFFCQCSKMPQK